MHYIHTPTNTHTHTHTHTHIYIYIYILTENKIVTPQKTKSILTYILYVHTRE